MCVFSSVCKRNIITRILLNGLLVQFLFCVISVTWLAQLIFIFSFVFVFDRIDSLLFYLVYCCLAVVVDDGFFFVYLFLLVGLWLFRWRFLCGNLKRRQLFFNFTRFLNLLSSRFGYIRFQVWPSTRPMTKWSRLIRVMHTCTVQRIGNGQPTTPVYNWTQMTCQNEEKNQ